MKTITEFVKENKLTMKVTPADSNPNMEVDLKYPMDHWKCVLRFDGRRMTITFSMGSGHHGKEPEINDVLYCLASDANTVENARSFEDWCGDLGFDTDSRRAEKLWKASEKEAAKLEGLLGRELYEDLLWNCEED
jgi:hypothetical protein